MRISKLVAGLMAASALAGCSAVDRIKDIDGGPKVNPITGPVAQTVTNMPMPPVPTEPRGNSSLWQAGARSFFHDPRASRIGDIITVNVSVADAAKFSNTTQRSRTNSDDANLTNFFGLEKSLAATGMDPANLIKMGSDMSNVGAGGIDRSESVNLTLAALVTQVLPNGNMVIGGHQQMKVNNELRDLEVTGIVRTEDITSANPIDLSHIAEARITYGGKGTVTDVQTPRYGSQLLDILMPW